MPASSVRDVPCLETARTIHYMSRTVSERDNRKCDPDTTKPPPFATMIGVRPCEAEHSAEGLQVAQLPSSAPEIVLEFRVSDRD